MCVADMLNHIELRGRSRTSVDSVHITVRHMADSPIMVNGYQVLPLQALVSTAIRVTTGGWVDGGRTPGAESACDHTVQTMPTTKKIIRQAMKGEA